MVRINCGKQLGRFSSQRLRLDSSLGLRVALDSAAIKADTVFIVIKFLNIYSQMLSCVCLQA